MNYKAVIIFFALICCVFAGGAGYSVWNGSWNVDARSMNLNFASGLFLFWMGIAFSGAFLSAFLRVLDVKVDRRTFLLAELFSICSLVVAVFYPMFFMENFFMAKIFCYFCAYGLLLSLFFVIHLAGENLSEHASVRVRLEQIRKPMAWIIAPLSLWGLSTMSLNFMERFVSGAHGGFFAGYVVFWAAYLGVSLMNLLISAEYYRVRVLEKQVLLGSWFLCALWLWNFFLRGQCNFVSIIFACALPQLFFVDVIRESVYGRVMLFLSVLVGGVTECLSIVMHGREWHFAAMDLCLLAFGIVLFMLLFYGVRVLFSRYIENGEILMGEVEEDEKGNASTERKNVYVAPLTSPEFKVLRFPVLCGLLCAVVYAAITGDWIVFFLPIVALVCGLMLCLKPLCVLFKAKILEFRSGRGR